MPFNKQAEELNSIIEEDCPAILDLLSERGKGIFFPKLGIVSQSLEAKNTKINATIGIAKEDDGSPMRLSAIADKISLDPNEVFTYASSFGKQQLRELWKKNIYEKNPSLKAELSLPVVTNALTHGLYTLGYLFVDENDEVILPDLYWGNYSLIFRQGFGAAIKTFNTFSQHGFDTASLKRALSGKGKKILLLNFPNNPAGYTPTEDEALKITEIIRERAEAGCRILVICDDAYFGLVYEEGIYKESIFSNMAGLHENVLAVKADGATKEDFVWGLRVGFLTYSCKSITKNVCEALELKTTGVVRSTISNASHLSQSLVLAGMESKSSENEKRAKYEILKSRYEKVKSCLDDPRYSDLFEPLPFNSGYFMCIRLKKNDPESVRKALLERYDTGVIAISGVIRIAYSSLGEKEIPLIFENICKVCKNIG
ncbi:aminotransferase class I/II-fold pyridoxal phosphate-dependent enzyme [Candidatus Woesearchaeota archaeon]|nr:aminotransferase class I/II-fold pyridoxal phosphate-dependent enzyme [Candidatus Woesearchaeota archaeon]